MDEVKKLFSGYKMRRFVAFILDLTIICLIWWGCYILFDAPDWYKVMELTNAATAAQGTVTAQEAANAMNVAFGNAYVLSLLIWLGYELLSSLILQGATIGKLICRLKTVSIKENDNGVITFLRIIFRSVIKFLLIYLFSAIPFLISVLSIFANSEHRSGSDTFAGTKVIDTFTAK